MKIKPEDAEKVTDLISVFIAQNDEAVKRHAAKVSPKRLRWDIYNAAVPYDPVIKQIYAYANDDHIDTLLRKVFKHST